jgi:hypothetical protein
MFFFNASRPRNWTSDLSKWKRYHLRSWKSSAGTVLLIWAVRSFINGYDLTVINSPVHQNSCLDFFTAVVISLSRCDFPAVISAQKISAETVRPYQNVTKITFLATICARPSVRLVTVYADLIQNIRAHSTIKIYPSDLGSL